MSKKNLLKEEQIRRFQQLAGVPVINEGGMGYGHKNDMGDAHKYDMGDAHKYDMGKAHKDDDMDGEEEFELAMDDVDTLEQTIDILQDIVAASKGGDMDDEDMDDDMDMDDDEEGDLDDEDMDMDMEDDEDEDTDDDEDDDEKMLQEALQTAKMNLLKDKRILREVARRVSKRLKS